MGVLPFALSLSILAAAPDGPAIYQEHCASCHGDEGEGVAEEYDEILVGKRSIASLTKYIDRKMPEDEEHLVVGEDALAVAAYIHEAFYSPEAQARLQPARRSLLHLSRQQHHNAITELIVAFRWIREDPNQNGLKAEYYSFQTGKGLRKKEKVLERIEPRASFDLATSPAIDNLNPEEYTITWVGSLVPPETGNYQFRIHTPNGAKFFLNRTSDNDPAVIDGWVSSGNEMRELTGSLPLVGAFPTRLRLDFLSFQEEVSSILLEWKPPHGTWETIPTRYLWPESSAKLLLLDTNFPPDDASLGYERGSSVSKAWKNAIAKAAIEASLQIKEDLDGLARTTPDDPKRGEKIRLFCENFATRAFCRPLTVEQKERFLDRFFQALPPEEAAQKSLLLTLSSPYFLYPNLPAPEDSYTIARTLSLALSDSLPQNKLWGAASKGQLITPQQREQAVRQLLKDPRTRLKVQRFFHHWLALSEREDLRKDSEAFPDFDEQIIADLRYSLDCFLAEVVWSPRSDYRELFLSKDFFFNQRLADYYEIPSNTASEFTRLSAADDQRAGVLTHPYLLAAFSYHKQTSPIHRGVYLGRNVLGRYLKPPPNAIEFKDSDFDPTLTMREKVTDLTKDSSCMSCHEVINPIGFSLERFDATGRYRERENGKVINTASRYPTPDDRTIEITGPHDLAQIAVESPDAHRAFIQNLFHHLVQQPVAAYGASAMDDLQREFVQKEFNIQELIVAMMLLITEPEG